MDVAMWFVLRFLGYWVEKTLKKYRDVSRHTQIHRSVLVVPLDFDAAEYSPIPVNWNRFLKFLQGID